MDNTDSDKERDAEHDREPTDAQAAFAGGDPRKRPLPAPRQLNREELEALRARLARRDHNRR